MHLAHHIIFGWLGSMSQGRTTRVLPVEFREGPKELKWFPKPVRCAILAWRLYCISKWLCASNGVLLC